MRCTWESGSFSCAASCLVGDPVTSRRTTSPAADSFIDLTSDPLFPAACPLADAGPSLLEFIECNDDACDGVEGEESKAAAAGEPDAAAVVETLVDSGDVVRDVAVTSTAGDAVEEDEAAAGNSVEEEATEAATTGGG